MRIGISSPITISSFYPYLDKASLVLAKNITGLKAPAVDAVAVELLKIGHEIVIFTLDKSVTNPILLEGPHLKIYVGPYRDRARDRALTLFIPEIRHLRRFIKSEKLNIIHAHWTYEFAIAALCADCPVVCTVRDVAEVIFNLSKNPYRYIRLWMSRFFFLVGSRVKYVANSPYTERQLKVYHPKIPFEVIPNSVSSKFISEKARHLSGKVFVSINNGWNARKNIDGLIRAFRLVRNEIPNAQLWLVGASFAEGCEGQRRLSTLDSSILEGVRFLGEIDHAALPELYAKADVLVHPSLEESFGNTLIEAMASGIPVVGGEGSGAVPWVLNYGKAGVLCNVEDPQDLACAMKRVIGDSRFYSKVARAGFDHVRSMFSAESVAKRTLAYYERVLLT